MAARIIELQPRPEKLRADQADELRQALLPFAAAYPEPVRELVAHIARATASRSRWTFVMLSPRQNEAVVAYLADHSSRPLKALRLWSICFSSLDIATGEIMLSRDEMAGQISDTPRNVSRIMSELESFGAISRRREKVRGMSGQGIVRYFLNPRVATHLAGKERDDAQAAAPQLRLVP
jgi:hypothetical protein